MLYDFICPACGHGKQVNIPASELKTLEVKCDGCGSPMRRNWKSNVSISSNDRSENIEEMSWIKKSLKKRPSGKTRVLY